MQSPFENGSSYLPIISEMITPAIFILAAGSLVNSTLLRLARIVDRTRVLIDQVASGRQRADHHAAQVTLACFPLYKRRAALVEHALTMFYAAIGMFVAGSLAITIEHFISNPLPWIPVLLVVLGALLLLIGSIALVIETHTAAGSLRREIDVGVASESLR